MNTHAHAAETETPHKATQSANDKKGRNPNVGVHVVLIHKANRETITLMAASKKELSKAIADLTDYEVIAAFKGRKLAVKEKKAFNFS